MNWIDPLAAIDGPSFLLIFAMVIAVAICLGQIFVNSSDTTDQAPRMLIPANPDPYAIAYLRGGESEVLRLALFTLIKRRILTINGVPFVDKIKPGDRLVAGPIGSDFNPIEAKVTRFFSMPHSVGEAFKSSLPQSLVTKCRAYKTELEVDNLLSPPERVLNTQKARTWGLITIDGLGGYRLVSSIAHNHHNVGFLIVMLIVSNIIILTVFSQRRLSNRGRQYVAQLQQAFAQLKRRAVGTQQDDNRSQLLVTLYGYNALAGTPDAAYGQLFVQQASNSGCGSGGCGSGGGSSGGDGGGGGGCGGGGCGG